MAGGDMRLHNSVTGYGMASQMECIDAHSRQEGDFTEARRVAGAQVFLTPEGARALDALVSGKAYEFRAERDPGALERFLLGDLVGPKGEQYQGRVER